MQFRDALGRAGTGHVNPSARHCVVAAGCAVFANDKTHHSPGLGIGSVSPHRDYQTVLKDAQTDGPGDIFHAQ